MTSWHELPGPREFIRQVTQSLADGRNVLVVLPRVGPNDILDAIRFSSGEQQHWTTTPPFPVDADPLIVMQDALRFETDDRRALTVEAFARSEWLQNRVIAVDLAAESWHLWRRFLSRHEEICRSIPPLQRCLLCVGLRWLGREVLPREDVCLAVHVWRGVVLPIDVETVTSQLTVNDHHGLETRVLRRTAAELALWDLDLCQLIMESGLRSAIEPSELLLRYAKRVGFQRIEDESPSALLANGVVQLFAGKEEYHSSYLILRGAAEKVRQRLWKAQISVLLPFVEEKRVEILESSASAFRLPHRAEDGQIIRRMEELEIGNMYHQLVIGEARCSDKVTTLVRILREIRNRLAHVELVGKELVENLDLLDCPVAEM